MHIKTSYADFILIFSSKEQEDGKGECSLCAGAQLCHRQEVAAPCLTSAQADLGSHTILLLMVPIASLKAIPVS